MCACKENVAHIKRQIEFEEDPDPEKELLKNKH